MDKIDKFLSCMWKSIEFANLTTAITREQAIGNDKYFVWDSNDTKIRSKKENIVYKRYFLVDFDIRENHKAKTKEILSDDELMHYLEYIKEKLSEVWYFSRSRGMIPSRIV